MTDRGNAHHPPGQPISGQPIPETSPEEALASKLPPQERRQPDPALRLSFGRLGAGTVALAAIMAAFILGVVLYGLNSSG